MSIKKEAVPGSPDRALTRRSGSIILDDVGKAYVAIQISECNQKKMRLILSEAMQEVARIEENILRLGENEINWMIDELNRNFLKPNNQP